MAGWPLPTFFFLYTRFHRIFLLFFSHLIFDFFFYAATLNTTPISAFNHNQVSHLIYSRSFPNPFLFSIYTIPTWNMCKRKI